LSENNFDVTLVPTIGRNNSKESTLNPNDAMTNNNVSNINSELVASSDNNINVEEIFSAPGVIIKDLLSCKFVINVLRKESQLDYVKLLFSKCNECISILIRFRFCIFIFKVLQWNCRGLMGKFAKISA